MLIDTHTHLYWEDFKSDLDQVIDRALQAEVTTVVNVGVDIPTSQLAAEFTANHSSLSTYSSVGIHPHEAYKYFNNSELIQQDIVQLEKIALTNPDKVKAVGECGLDFFFTGNPDYQPSNISIEELKDLQIKLLVAQVTLAKKLNLPLIIHCRDAWNQIFDLVNNHFGILHCYSGDENTTKRALQTRFMISFAANITYPKNDYLREAIKTIPLNHIVLETDCPFLSPQSSRGQRNEPKSVREIAELIANLKGISFHEVAASTTQNARQVLNLV